MENQTNYEGLGEHLDWQGQVEYEELLARAKDEGMTAEAIEDLKAADLLYIAEHPDEFE